MGMIGVWINHTISADKLLLNGAQPSRLILWVIATVYLRYSLLFVLQMLINLEWHR